MPRAGTERLAKNEMKDTDKQTLHPDRWRHDENDILGERHHDNRDDAT